MTLFFTALKGAFFDKWLYGNGGLTLFAFAADHPVVASFVAVCGTSVIIYKNYQSARKAKYEADTAKAEKLLAEMKLKEEKILLNKIIQDESKSQNLEEQV